MKIKIYSDGADALLEMAADPRIQGLTTNPTLMKKAGIRDYRSFCKKILPEITAKPISLEVFADDFNEMERQAHEIASWGKNVYVKIPVMNTEGKSSLALVQRLTQAGIQLNVTAVLTLSQVMEVAQSLRGGAPSVISVFAGRIADTGRDPMPYMRAASEMIRATNPSSELLWASVREVLNIVQAEQCGCDIVTVPPGIIKKMKLFGQDLIQVSLDTVKVFRQDALSAGFEL